MSKTTRAKVRPGRKLTYASFLRRYRALNKEMLKATGEKMGVASAKYGDLILSVPKSWVEKAEFDVYGDDIRRLSHKKSVKKTAPRKTAPKKVARNPVKKLMRYVVQVDTIKGVGYLSAWDRRGGPQFDSDVTKALVGGDSNLMWHFATAVAERKPRGVKSVDVVPMSDVKKN